MQNNQKQVVEWVNIEEEIYQALVAEFKDDLSDWQAEIERHIDHQIYVPGNAVCTRLG